MSETPPPSVEELLAVVAELRVVNSRLRELVESQAARIEVLERQLGRNSSNSGRPPSSDPIFGKAPGRDRSSRERGKRRPVTF